MSYKIPMEVAEITLVYKTKVKAKDRPQLQSSRDAYWVLESHWSDQMDLLEEFNMLLIDQSSRVMGFINLSKGGIAGTVVDLKIAFAAALKARASGILLAHNHPSGNLQPSEADIKLTNQFRKAADILNLRVLDHLILSPDDTYYSFADNSLM